MGSRLRHLSVPGVFIRSSLSQSKLSLQKELLAKRGFGEDIGAVREVVKWNFLLIEHHISRGMTITLSLGCFLGGRLFSIIDRLDRLEALITTTKLVL